MCDNALHIEYYVLNSNQSTPRKCCYKLMIPVLTDQRFLSDEGPLHSPERRKNEHGLPAHPLWPLSVPFVL